MCLASAQATVMDVQRFMHQPDQEEMRAVYQFIIKRLGLEGL